MTVIGVLFVGAARKCTLEIQNTVWKNPAPRWERSDVKPFPRQEIYNLGSPSPFVRFYCVQNNQGKRHFWRGLRLIAQHVRVIARNMVGEKKRETGMTVLCLPSDPYDWDRRVRFAAVQPTREFSSKRETEYLLTSTRAVNRSVM